MNDKLRNCETKHVSGAISVTVKMAEETDAVYEPLDNSPVAAVATAAATADDDDDDDDVIASAHPSGPSGCQISAIQKTSTLPGTIQFLFQQFLFQQPVIQHMSRCSASAVWE